MHKTLIAFALCAATSVQAQAFPANEANARLVHGRAVEG